MTDKSVQVGVGRPFDTKFFGADVVDGLIVDHERTVRVLQRGMRSQNRIIRLNYGSRNTRSGVDSELQLGLKNVFVSVFMILFPVN